MQILVALLFLVLSNAYAKKSHLTCSKFGTHIMAINGVNVNEEKFLAFEVANKRLGESLDLKYVDSNLDVSIESYHNQSFGALYDGYETWKLYIKRLQETSGRHILIDTVVNLFANYLMGSSQFTSGCQTAALENECNALIEYMNGYTEKDFKDFKTVIDELLKVDKKIIFLSHSAGGIFVDNLRDYIKSRYPDKYQYTSHLAIARPFNTNHERSYYLNFEKDELLKLLRVASNDVPPVNVRQSKSCLNVQDPKDLLINHDYINCYLSSDSVDPDDELLVLSSDGINAKNLVIDSLYKMAGELENNDINCCGKSSNGKIWMNQNLIGGFISNDIEVTGSPYISKNSFLCGKGKIDSSFGSISINNSKILGDLDIESPLSLIDVQLANKSKLVSRSTVGNPYSEITLSKVNIEGKAEFELVPNSTFRPRRVKVYNTKISGNSKFQGGDLELEDSELNEAHVLGGEGYLKLKNVKNKKHKSISIQTTSSGPSHIYNLIGDQNIRVKSGTVLIEDLAPLGDLDVESGSRISIKWSKIKSLKGKCSGDIIIQVQMENNELEFSDCDQVYFTFESTGDVRVKGTSNIGGKFNGINSEVSLLAGHQLDLGANVTGTVNIKSISGMSVEGRNILGNLELNNDSCTNATSLTLNYGWGTSFTHSFTHIGHICTDFGTGPICFNSGMACI